MDPHLLRSSSDGQNYSSYIAARTVQAQEKHKMCFCSKFMKLCVCDIFKSELVCVSYVQWVQSGGARVVPVIIGRSRQYYNELFGHLNGLLLPGGSAPLTGGGGYAAVGRIFFQLATQAMKRG